MEVKRKTTGRQVLRALLWVAVLLGLPVAFSLSWTSQTAEAMANGTAKNLETWGQIFLGLVVSLLAINFTWGVAIFAEKWYEQKWSIGRVFGKVIGGGIWRVLVFGGILLVGFIGIGPMVTGSLMSQELNIAERLLMAGEPGIRSDFLAGTIDADDYIGYLIDLVTDNGSLPEQYQTHEAIMMPNILAAVEENLGELEPETVQKALEVVSGNGIEFGIDASMNLGTGEKGWLDSMLGIEPAFAYTPRATILNKAKLSGSGKFVVFYTDKGDDKISDEQAEYLASMMDEIVDDYANNLDMAYSYQKTAGNGREKERAQQEVLEANGLSRDQLDTAMPVYVANPFKGESNVLAFYVDNGFDGVLENILAQVIALKNTQVNFMMSTPVYPFMTILPSNLDNPSLKLVAAHELGHHYSALYCYATSGDACVAKDFIRETAATWMAMRAVREQPVGVESNAFLRHHQMWLESGMNVRIDSGIPDFLGYPVFGFLENYAEIVPGAKEKILAALVTDEALTVLRQEATEEDFRRVMLQLAEKNLTNGYEYASLWAERLPQGIAMQCTDICQVEQQIEPVAMEYWYFPVAQYGGTKILIEATVAESMVVMRRTMTGEWEKVETANQRVEYEIESLLENDFSYDAIAIVVVNTGMDVAHPYTVAVAPIEIAEVAEIEWGEGCHRLDFGQMMDASSGLIGALTVFDKENADGYQEVWGQAGQLREELEGFDISVCDVWLGAGVDFEQIQESLRKELDIGKVVNVVDEGGRRSALILGIDAISGIVKAYQIEQDKTETYLVILNIDY